MKKTDNETNSKNHSPILTYKNRRRTEEIIDEMNEEKSFQLNDLSASQVSVYSINKSFNPESPVQAGNNKI